MGFRSTEVYNLLGPSRRFQKIMCSISTHGFGGLGVQGFSAQALH